jgi:hypothetical protein
MSYAVAKSLAVFSSSYIQAIYCNEMVNCDITVHDGVGVL